MRGKIKALVCHYPSHHPTRWSLSRQWRSTSDAKFLAGVLGGGVRNVGRGEEKRRDQER